MPKLPEQLERVFSLIELNAPRVPIFRKFVNGEQLDADDVVELEKATRELGLFGFAQFVAEATPDVLNAIAQAHDALGRAARVRDLFKSVFG